MRHLFITFIVLLVIGCSPSGEDKPLSERIARIENGLQPVFQIEGEDVPTYTIEERLKELGIPSISIAFVNDGKVEWARAYGMADSSENRAVNTETMYLAGSISKPVAAVHAHQLAERGVINLDGNVNDYLTSWKLPDNEFTAKEKVTTRRILNHTAGLTVWGFGGYDKGDTIPSVAEVLDGRGNTDSVRVYKEPGESWMYSGGGYTIMQLMMTDLDGRSFPDLMQEEVLNPLEMTSSTYENPLPQKYHGIAATGYRRDGSEVEGKWPIYPEMAAAGLWTTPSQLILYGIEMQRILQSGEDGLLKNETVKTMVTPGMNDHGLGPAATETVFGHGGADEGFRADLTVWKDQPNAVVLMVNSDNGSIMREVMQAIAKEYELPGFEPDLRSVGELSLADREKFTGAYSMGSYGETQITTEENGLRCTGGWFTEPAYLLPENGPVFFNQKSGTRYTFLLDGETVTGFRVHDQEAEKLTE